MAERYFKIGCSVMSPDTYRFELLDELMSASSVGDYLEGHRFSERALSDYLQELLADRELVQPTIVHEAQLNPTFGYQVFMGKRGAGRDTVLRIAFAMRLTPRETNRALQAARANALYPKNRRDAILIYCLEHETGLMGANAALYEFGEDLLC